jgi:hypothetical protein
VSHPFELGIFEKENRMRIKNWEKFQHFKNRKPVWIKLYLDLMDDKKWFDLSGDDAKTLIMLWMVGAKNDGDLPDLETLSFRLRIDEEVLKSSFLALNHWLEGVDNNAISSGYQDDALDKSKIRKDKSKIREREDISETSSDDMHSVNQVWESYLSFFPDKKIKLSPKRIAKIRTAMKSFSIPELCRAIENFSNDTWSERYRYNDITHCFKNFEAIERWVHESPKPKHTGAEKAGVKTLKKEDFDGTPNKFA